MLENKHEQKVLSQNIMIYRKYRLLSCKDKYHIQCQFCKQLYIAPEDFKQSDCGSSSKNNGQKYIWR